MKIKRYISKILNGTFILIIFLFVLDTVTSFEIKNQAIKSFTYFGIIILTPLILIWNLWYLKKTKRKILSSALPMLTLIVVMILGPMKIIFSSSSWKTQTVLYQNKKIANKKVEFQTQDIGALGYNKRTVEITYLTYLFMMVSSVEKDIDKQVEWKKVTKKTLKK